MKENMKKEHKARIELSTVSPLAREQPTWKAPGHLPSSSSHFQDIWARLTYTISLLPQEISSNPPVTEELQKLKERMTGRQFYL